MATCKCCGKKLSIFGFNLDAMCQDCYLLEDCDKSDDEREALIERLGQSPVVCYGAFTDIVYQTRTYPTQYLSDLFVTSEGIVLLAYHKWSSGVTGTDINRAALKGPFELLTSSTGMDSRLTRDSAQKRASFCRVAVFGSSIEERLRLFRGEVRPNVIGKNDIRSVELANDSLIVRFVLNDQEFMLTLVLKVGAAQAKRLIEDVISGTPRAPSNTESVSLGIPAPCVLLKRLSKGQTEPLLQSGIFDTISRDEEYLRHFMEYFRGVRRWDKPAAKAVIKTISKIPGGFSHAFQTRQKG